MESTQHEGFLTQLRHRLESDPRVQGLILLGSTADPILRDNHSDHDFWIIAETPALSDYLADTGWLPDAEQILFTVRHGASHRTVVYRNRHKVEYAVFDHSTARSGKIDRFRVVLDREGIAELAEEIRHNSLLQGAEYPEGPVSVENFYVLAWTGWERVLRGEVLSAHRYVDAGTDVLLQLLANAHVVPDEANADRLDSRRRLEQRAPDLAAALHRVLTLPPSEAITELVRLAEYSLPSELLVSSSSRIDPVRSWLGIDGSSPPPGDKMAPGAPESREE
jgi:hypothetical protein